MKSDVYEGHFIPAGSIVIPNVWYALFPLCVSFDSSCQLISPRGMLHDPSIFIEPDRFDPERWFSPDVPAFPIQAFGFGARLCPGRFFARRSIWANMVGILAAFDIVPTEDGPPEKRYSSGVISYVVLELRNGSRANFDGSRSGGTGTGRYVKPFRCYIRPRSEAAASLVRNTESEL
jgi:hypothetical protein